MTSRRANRYPPELRARAVRVLLEQRSEYRSEYAAISSIAPKTGCNPDTLRAWLRQHERNNSTGDAGLTSDERQRLKELEQEVRELRRSNDILRQHQRSVQSGGDTPTELEKPTGSGAGHTGVGGLVQQSSAA